MDWIRAASSVTVSNDVVWRLKSITKNESYDKQRGDEVPMIDQKTMMMMMICSGHKSQSGKSTHKSDKKRKRIFLTLLILVRRQRHNKDHYYETLSKSITNRFCLSILAYICMLFTCHCDVYMSEERNTWTIMMIMIRTRT